MDDISRGSASDDPGQRIVDKGEDRIPLDISDRARHLAPTEKEVSEHAEILSDRENLLMSHDTPADPEPTSADPGPDDPDEIPVEDRPSAATPEDLEAGGEALAPEEGELSRVLCALLLSSREALSMLRLAQSTNTTPKRVAKALEKLRETMRVSGLPLELNIAGEQVRLLTSPDVFGYLSNLRNVKKQEKLSAAALETLAVVAYRQPVMIEAIRGVKAGPILRTLLDHRMVKITGRADVPGRPLQYGTTQHFLETVRTREPEGPAQREGVPLAVGFGRFPCLTTHLHAADSAANPRLTRRTDSLESPPEFTSRSSS